MRCCMCLDQQPEVVLVPCGHMNLCTRCAHKCKQKPWTDGGGVCPTAEAQSALFRNLSHCIEEVMRCCMCLDQQPEVVLVPCGHMNLCTRCAHKCKQKPWTDGGGVCPNCRSTISIIQKSIPLQ